MSPLPEPEATRPADASLSSRSVTGIAWSLAGLAVAEPLRIVVTAVLARILDPAAFGILGMATVFIGLASIGNDFGLQASIVRAKCLSAEELDSLFWFNLLIGFGCTAVGLLAAVPVATLFRQPQVAPVLAALSMTFTVASLGQIQGALVRREMDFRTPAMANVYAVAVAGVVGVAAALAGWGVWALVVNTLAGPAVSTAYLEIKTRYLPGWRMRWSDVRGHAVFGGTLTGAEFAAYGGSYVDNFVVGRQLGASALGVYGLAYNLVTYPVRRFAGIVAMVTLPAFSRIKDERERYAAAWRQAMDITGSVSVPLLAASAVAGADIIYGLYGPKWVAAILPFRLLCLAGVARCFAVFPETAFKSRGEARRYLWWMCVTAVLIAIATLASWRFGVNAVALAVALATAAGLVGALVDAALRVGMPLPALAGVLLRHGAMAAVSAGVAYPVHVAGAAFGVPAILVGVVSVVIGLGAAWVVFRWVPGFEALRDAERMARGSIRG